MPQDYLRDALECIFITISKGNEDTAEIIQEIKKETGAECEKLVDLFELLQSTTEHPISIELDTLRVSRRKFKAQFKQAVKALPEAPFLDNCSDGPLILSSISSTIAKIGELNNLRAELTTSIGTLAQGTNSYHINKYIEQARQQKAELAEELLLFKKNHLLDGVQAPVNPVLLLDEKIRNTDEWKNKFQHQNIEWTVKHESMFASLHLEVEPKIWSDLCSLRLGSDSLPGSARSNLSTDSGIEIRSFADRDKKKTRNRKTRSRRSKELHIGPLDKSPRDLETKISRLRAQVAKLEAQAISLENETSVNSPLTKKNSNRNLLSEFSEEDKIIKSPSQPIIESPEVLTRGGLKLPIAVSNRKGRRDRAKSSRGASGFASFFSMGQSNSSNSNDWSAESPRMPKRSKDSNSSLVHSKVSGIRARETTPSDFKITLRSLSSGPDDSSGEIIRNCSGAASARSSNRSPLKRVGPSSRLIARCTGYWTEEGTSRDPPIALCEEQLQSSSSDDLQSDQDVPHSKWFSRFFKQGTYQSYISRHGPEGNAIVLVKKEKLEKNSHRVLYQSSERTIGVLIPSSQVRGKILTKGNILKKLLYFVDPLISAKSFLKCETDIHSILDELQKLDSMHILEQTKFKIGLLNWQADNKNEEDLFGNNSISPNYQEFLDILGKKVELLSWPEYSGGLDTDSSGTGKYSLFTTHGYSSIMFHVAAYLPFSASNSQQLARKRHIGNDVVIVVFNEASKPYLSSLIASQFIHVIIAVSKEIDDNKKPYFSVAVTAKENVPTFGPSLPTCGRFYSAEALRKFLVEKMTNAEKACAYAPVFVSRFRRSRYMLLESLMRQYYYREEPSTHFVPG